MTDGATSGGPLEGIRVVDLTRMIMGPYATQILADQGAEVTVFEPLDGDPIRNGAGVDRGISGMSLNLMRGKRSVLVDLKDEAGKAAVLEAVRRADVLVTNMRPRALARLGLDYAQVREVNASIVYCQGQGWPLGSERENDPAYDDVVQAASGAADLGSRVTGEPSLLPTLIADKVAGVFIAQAVAAALYRRSRTGQGDHIEVPMVPAMTSFMLLEHGAAAMHEPPPAAAGYERILTPGHGPIRTTDGWVQLLPYTPQQFAALFAALGRSELSDDRLSEVSPLSRSSDSLYRDLRDAVSDLSTTELEELCARLDVPIARVATIDDLVSELPLADHPLTGSYRVLPPAARFASMPDGATPRPAPEPGRDTTEVLHELTADDA